MDSQIVSPAEHFATGGAAVAGDSVWERREAGRRGELGEERYRA